MIRATQRHWLSFILVALACVGCSTSRPAPVRNNVDLAGTLVIGASVSAGSEVSLGLDSLPPGSLARGQASLSDALGAVTSGPSPPNCSSVLFFTNPRRFSAQQAERVATSGPTIVFALDYLFWHAYGAPMTDAQRRGLFEEGLTRIESFGCPVVVGDIPDMSHVIGGLMTAEQVPSASVRAELNERLRSFAADRPRIIILNVGTIVGESLQSGSLRLGGREYRGLDARLLMTESGLHVSAAGLIAAAQECLEQLAARGFLPRDSTWETDPVAAHHMLIERASAGSLTPSPIQGTTTHE